MKPETPAAGTVHATCIVIGECGVLIRGPSGAGKSALARDLLAQTGPQTFARLVADDRVILTPAHGRLIAAPHPRITGQIEQRGLGIIARAHEPACVIALVLDLGETVERMPGAESESAQISGIAVPRLAARTGQEALPLALAWLSGARKINR